MSGQAAERVWWVCAYLYDLADEERSVVPWVHEDSPGNHFTVVKSLSTEASFSQAAGINKLEHLTEEENSGLPQWWNKQALHHLCRCVHLIKKTFKKEDRMFKTLRLSYNLVPWRR